jgi:hypothetical protein
MKQDCPFCGGPGSIAFTPKGLPYGHCPALRCGAASKPAPTMEGAVRNWATHVRSAEAIPGDWSLTQPLSQAA